MPAKEPRRCWVAERNFMMGTMQASVQRRLAELTRSVGESDTEGLADLARVEIPLLVAALRHTLAGHRPDVRGRCAVCRTRFSLLRLRRRGNIPPLSEKRGRSSLRPDPRARAHD